MVDIYSFEDLEKIVDKISKIRKKKYLEQIRDLIIENNPDIKVTENSNGLFFHFHNLSNETYIKINIFLKNISKAKKIYNSDQLSSEYIPYSNDDFPFDSDPKLKYSNREKNIIKRKIYDKELNGHSEENIDNNDLINLNNINEAKSNIIVNNQNSNIFIKKSKK